MSKLLVVLGDHNNEEEDDGEEERLVDQVVFIKFSFLFTIYFPFFF